MSTIVGLALAVALFPSTARAGDAVFEGRLTEILPTGEATGDGHSPVSFEVLVLDADGTPVTGLKAKLSSTHGRAGNVTEVAPGHYRAEWTPPIVHAPADERVTIQGKTADKKTVRRTWDIHVQPVRDQEIRVSTSPTALTLGQDATANIAVETSRRERTPTTPDDLLVRATVGTVDNLTPMGDGRFTMLYRPPDQAEPQVAVISVADRFDPEQAAGSVAIPLTGTVELPLVGPKNGQVLVTAGERDFGPVDLDKKGKGKVTVTAKPGVTSATVVPLGGENPVAVETPLPVPPLRLVEILPMAPSLPGDPAAALPVLMRATDVDGNAATDAVIALVTDAGTVTTPTHQGNGVYAATLTPNPETVLRTTSITATLQGEDGAPTSAESVAEFSLLPARVTEIGVRAEPELIPADGGPFTLVVDAKGAGGVGLPSRDVRVRAAGAKCAEPPEDVGDGSYRFACQTIGSSFVDVVATVATPAGTNPVHRIVAWTDRGRLPNDGLSSTVVNVVTVDRFGWPVADVPVTIKTTVGDGSIPSKATTDANGLAQVTWTAGRTPGVVNLLVEATGHQGAVGFLQAPKKVAPDLEVPVTADETMRRLVETWTPSVTRVRIERAEAAAAE